MFSEKVIKQILIIDLFASQEELQSKSKLL